MESKTKKDISKPQTLEVSLKRLSEISNLMDNEDLPLKEAMTLYSEASELVGSCTKDIAAAQKDMKKILEKLF